MKKIISFLFFTGLLLQVCFAQTDSIWHYIKTSAMIPMRDGIKLHTVILSPVGATKPVPVLLQRTPYGASGSDTHDDSIVSMNALGPYYGIMLKEGYPLRTDALENGLGYGCLA